MQSIESESQKQLLIESIVCLKDMMRAYSEDQINKIRSQPGPSHEREYEREGEHDAQQISLPEDQRYGDALVESQQTERELAEDEAVLELIDEDFEKGLLSLRELVKQEQVGKVQLTFEQKERIVVRLLVMTTQGYKNPQEQYK